MSSKNIMTGIVVALALVLVVAVILVKSNVFEKEETTTATEIETVIESEIIVVSETDMWGDITFLTMVTKYARPKYSSLHTYPSTTTTTEESSTEELTEEETTETTTEIQYVEMSTVVHVTDENGNRLFEEDGTPITETVYYTVDANSLTTTAPTEYIPETSVIEVTNELGETITEIVTLPPPSETTSTTASSNTRWDTTTTTKKDGINVDLKTPGRDDILAEKIVEQINEDRTEKGLEPLAHDSDLRASARKKSLAMALPSVYNQDDIIADYTVTTKFGGESLYMKVVDSTKDKALSSDVTKIGLGIVVQDGEYYTSVIYG